MATGAPLFLLLSEPPGVGTVTFARPTGVVVELRLGQVSSLPAGITVRAVEPVSLLGYFLTDLVCTMVAKANSGATATQYDYACEDVWRLADYWQLVTALAIFFHRQHAARWLMFFDSTSHANAKTFWEERARVCGVDIISRSNMREVFFAPDGSPKQRVELSALLQDYRADLKEGEAKAAFNKFVTAAQVLGTQGPDFDDFVKLAYDTLALWKVNSKMVRFGIEHLSNFPLDSIQGHFWFRFASSFLGNLIVDNKFGRPLLTEGLISISVLNPNCARILGTAVGNIAAALTKIKHLRTRLQEHLSFPNASTGIGVEVDGAQNLSGSLCFYSMRYTNAAIEDTLRMEAILEDTVHTLSFFMGIGSLSFAPDPNVDFGFIGGTGVREVEMSIQSANDRFLEANELYKWWNAPPCTADSNFVGFRAAYLSWMEFYALRRVSLVCRELRDTRNYQLLGQYVPYVRQFFYLASISVTKFPGSLKCVQGKLVGNDVEFRVDAVSCGKLVRGFELRNWYFAHPTEHLFQNYERDSGIFIWKEHLPPGRPSEPVPALDQSDMCSADHFFSSSEIDNWILISEKVTQALFSRYVGPSACAPLDYVPLPPVIGVRIKANFNVPPGHYVHLIGDHKMLGGGNQKLHKLRMTRGIAVTVVFPKDVPVVFKFACFDDTRPGSCIWQSETEFNETFTGSIPQEFVVRLFQDKEYRVTFDPTQWTGL